MITLFVRPEEEAGVDPVDHKTIQDQTENDQDQQRKLIFVNMPKHQILTDEGRGDGEPGEPQTGKYEEECQSRILMGMAMKLRQRGIFTILTHPIDNPDSDERRNQDPTQIKIDLTHFKLIVKTKSERLVKLVYHDQNPRIER